MYRCTYCTVLTVIHYTLIWKITESTLSQLIHVRLVLPFMLQIRPYNNVEALDGCVGKLAITYQ